MLADIQRKHALAHGVVKCTCESDDLLFLLRVARLMELKKRALYVKKGQPASV